LGDNPEKVAVPAVPVMVAPPGMAVTVHDVAGRPPNTTVPVGVVQVG